MSIFDVSFVYMKPPVKLPQQKPRFTVSYSKTLAHLKRELKHLQARSVTIQAGFDSVRNDGWPYSSCKPSHPACSLQFAKSNSNEQLIFKSSKYSTFEANLRAISLTLEALRDVARYGVVEGEQYQGFKMLGSSIPMPAAAPHVMSIDEAVTVLSVYSGLPDTTILKDIDRAFRLAAKTAHPDNGGSHEAMAKVNEARKVLQAANL